MQNLPVTVAIDLMCWSILKFFTDSLQEWKKQVIARNVSTDVFEVVKHSSKQYRVKPLSSPEGIKLLDLGIELAGYFKEIDFVLGRYTNIT